MNPLIDRFLDDSLSESESAALTAWLKADPNHLRAFVEANVRDHHLRDAVRHSAQLRLVEKSPAAQAPRLKILRPAFWWAAAAMLAITIGAMMWRPGVLVEVVSSDQPGWQAGGHVRLRQAKLAAGSVQLRLTNGVLLNLTGPVSGVLESDMRFRLFSGRISADVGARGKNFTVLTDAGEVVDLGTRFGVEAERGGESRVAVFSGQVKVRSNAAGDFTTLSEGEAARFTALAGLRRWPQVAMAVDAAGLVSVPADSVLASVHDNLGDEQLHPFYGVVQGGLRSGAWAFTDKPNPRWALGETLPTWLEGADLVRTYHQFRVQKNYELTLTLRAPAAVFVLIDQRQPPPPWLVERFQQTGTHLRVGPWMQGMAGAEGAEIDGDGRPFLRFAVWRADAAAGDFVLGPSHAGKTRSVPFPLMYGVAVKALDQP